MKVKVGSKASAKIGFTSPTYLGEEDRARYYMYLHVHTCSICVGISSRTGVREGDVECFYMLIKTDSQ